MPVFPNDRTTPREMGAGAHADFCSFAAALEALTVAAARTTGAAAMANILRECFKVFTGALRVRE